MIYLDHAATSWPKPVEVCEAMVRALTELTANAGRGGHRASVASARMVFETRSMLAELFGMQRSDHVIFTRSCTEGLNLVIKGFLKPGDRVLVSPLEHNSVMRPLSRLASERGIGFETLPADPFGRVDPKATAKLIDGKKFALAIVAHASNANGAVQDIAGIRGALRDIPLLVDAAQSAGVLPIDVHAMGIDFLSCSAHKGLLGPTGVGICCLSERFDIPPLLDGGTGSDSDSFDQPTALPDRYEAGTLNLHGIAGLHAALAGLTGRGLVGGHKQQLAKQLIGGIKDAAGIKILSPSDGTALSCAFTIDGMQPDKIAVQLQEDFGILCRPGLQCAPAAHRHFGTLPAGSVRLSPGWGTTDDELEKAITAVQEICSKPKAQSSKVTA